LFRAFRSCAIFRQKRGPQNREFLDSGAVSAYRPSVPALLDWDSVGHKDLGFNAICHDSRYSRRQEAFVPIFRHSRLNKAPTALSCERCGSRSEGGCSSRGLGLGPLTGGWRRPRLARKPETDGSVARCAGHAATAPPLYPKALAATAGGFGSASAIGVGAARRPTKWQIANTRSARFMV
jgi:hypothetical protein